MKELRATQNGPTQITTAANSNNRVALVGPIWVLLGSSKVTKLGEIIRQLLKKLHVKF